MSPQFEILIKNCQLRGQPHSQYDIAISDGHINDIAESISGTALTEIDAHGYLVTESFVNAHLHLCKVYTLEMMDEEAMKDYHGSGMGKAMTAIELAARVKEKYAESWIIKNVRKAMALSAKYGCTHTRAFADVDTKAKLEGVKALIRAREEFRGVVDIQVVAFAQGLPNVVHVEEVDYLCLPEILAKVKKTVKKSGANRVILAACAPYYYQRLFDKAMGEVGVDSSLWRLVNFREQIGWVHGESQALATEKAQSILAMAVERLREQEPLSVTSTPVNHQGLVIGGGISGLISALCLAEQGFEVHLVEKCADL